MKVGDYVRTESYNNIPSKIGRIRNVEFYKGEIKYIFIDNDEDKNRCYDMSSIRGMSSNIIDLIEVGDYVNGDKVWYIDDLKGCMRQFNYDYENPNDDCGHWEEEIQSVVTKEQFESMEYKVGD